MSPYNETNIIKDVLYVMLWFFWAMISIMYWILSWKKQSIKNSILMIAIWWFIWWICWVLLDSTLAAWIWGSLSLEIMHSIKEYWPEIIKEKFKSLMKKENEND